MSDHLDAFLWAEALEAGRGQRAASLRHRRLQNHPLMLVPWQLGGEPFRFGALFVGGHEILNAGGQKVERWRP